MPWPKGYSKEQVRAMSPEERKEAFRKPKDEAPPEQIRQPEVRASKPSKQKWTMKAGSNWETAVSADESPDKYNIPRDIFPEGMDLFWATKSIYGQEQPQRLNTFYRAGWTPVHVDDFDGRFATMFSRDDSGYVVQEASILCARPLEMSISAKKREESRAREQIAIKEAAFRGGEMAATGANHPSAKGFNRISRSVERIEIPKD